jgi:hypothetical protein
MSSPPNNKLVPPNNGFKPPMPQANLTSTSKFKQLQDNKSNQSLLGNSRIGGHKQFNQPYLSENEI